MHLGLGIDTGGTYTDSVLYNFDEERVYARAKALTTKDNLVVGIRNSLSGLPGELMGKVQLVSLSTTLATNACVEGMGGRGKLVLMGYDSELYEKLGSKYGLPSCRDVIMLEGGHGQHGQVHHEPDWNELMQKVMACCKETDAFGVVEYWGIRNPEYEKKAKQLIHKWTGLPVVSAHELSGEINTLRRASTTLLNARLISLIDDLIFAVKKSLEYQGVKAPLMIVRGDGTLMSEEFALERPVETLLSGPAASVVGAMKLSGNSDCIAIDMGGTTSDLAVVRNNMGTLVEEGVDIGGWKTGTRAIKIKTVGLGGDSLISFDKYEKLCIGPRKATPLAWTAKRWPEIKDELRRIAKDKKVHSLSLGEFFYLTGNGQNYNDFSKDEMNILDALKRGPKSIEQLSDALESLPYFLKTERLESLGIVARSGLTPTDLMHVEGLYVRWDAEASRMGADILSFRLGCSVEQLAAKSKEYIERKLYMLTAQYLLERHWDKHVQKWDEQTEKILQMGFDANQGEIGVSITTPLPLVGIGAPIHIFLEKTAKALGTHAVVPEDAGVANAVGAITGSIIGEEKVLIKPHYEVSGISGYGCHSSQEYYETTDYKKALEWAKEKAGKGALEKAAAMGGKDVEVTVEFVENNASTREAPDGLLLETVVIGRGIGKSQRLAYA